MTEEIIDHTNSQQFLTALRDNLATKGCATCGIDGEIGAHSIVVDHVANDLSRVRLRDPHHGWEITVTAEAFLQRVLTIDGKGYKAELHRIERLPDLEKIKSDLSAYVQSVRAHPTQQPTANAVKHAQERLEAIGYQLHLLASQGPLESANSDAISTVTRFLQQEQARLNRQLQTTQEARNVLVQGGAIGGTDTAATPGAALQWVDLNNAASPIVQQIQQLWPKATGGAREKSTEVACVVIGGKVAGVVKIEPIGSVDSFASVPSSTANQSTVGLTLFVTEEHRGGGLGTQMLLAACDKAVSEGKSVYIADQTDDGVGARLYGGNEIATKFDVFHAIGKQGGRGEYLVTNKTDQDHRVKYLQVPQGQAYSFHFCNSTEVGRQHLTKYFEQWPADKTRFSQP